MRAECLHWGCEGEVAREEEELSVQQGKSCLCCTEGGVERPARCGLDGAREQQQGGMLGVGGPEESVRGVQHEAGGRAVVILQERQGSGHVSTGKIRQLRLRARTRAEAAGGQAAGRAGQDERRSDAVVTLPRTASSGFSLLQTVPDSKVFLAGNLIECFTKYFDIAEYLFQRQLLIIAIPTQLRQIQPELPEISTHLLILLKIFNTETNVWLYEKCVRCAGANLGTQDMSAWCTAVKYGGEFPGFRLA
ncbi:hypothetical protein C8J57DRAFT_1212145 [Mycena rebaudengoi]|nr:hypothetical protein C8J57DRAFT_1212145 [Mycena rebaudengoi]